MAPGHRALCSRRRGEPARSRGTKEDSPCRATSSNADDSVTWLHSYVTPDHKRTFCIYDAPTPEAIRRVAERNKLPVDRITEVRVLDPYFHR